MTLVLITGATRGIGRAAAVALARRGTEVAIVGQDPERVRATAEQAAAAGGGATVHQHVSDLTLMANVRALADEVRERYGQIDVLANNAGALFASRKETTRELARRAPGDHSCDPPTVAPARWWAGALRRRCLAHRPVHRGREGGRTKHPGPGRGPCA